jgi:hypothetical protein
LFENIVLGRDGTPATRCSVDVGGVDTLRKDENHGTLKIVRGDKNGL